MTEIMKQPAKALVLGGGGTTGISWEMGLLLGLHEVGSSVTGADLIIGKAGSYPEYRNDRFLGSGRTGEHLPHVR